MINTRSVILDILDEVFEKNTYIHIVISEYSKKYIDISEQDNAFIIKTVHGCVENKILIDKIISLFSKTNIKDLRPVIRNILRFSVYHILFMNKVPSSAIVNEAVKLTQKRKLFGLKSYVNAVLRNIIRIYDRDNKDIFLSDADIFAHISDVFGIKELNILYSFDSLISDEIKKTFKNYYGREILNSEFENIILSWFKNNDISIYLDYNKLSLNEACNILKVNNINYRHSSICEDVLLISGIKDIDKLYNLLGNNFYIIDAASVLSIKSMDIKEGANVLDLCAAPGGKSFVSMIKLNNTGNLVSLDKNENKVNILMNNLSKYNYDNIYLGINDACEYNENFKERFDYVICDLPCSGLGIIRKKPDIKYNYGKKIKDELLILQKRILDNAFSYLKNGGFLLFSTCTISFEENIKNRNYIISKGFSPISLNLDSYIKSYFEKYDNSSLDYAKKGYLQLFNGIHDVDGFFISLYKKEK